MSVLLFLCVGRRVWWLAGAGPSGGEYSSGWAFAMLVVDVLALTCLVIPLAASQQKRAQPVAFSRRLTQNPVDQALILPTHDPRKPWVTRTPRPTATPWLTLAATLARYSAQRHPHRRRTQLPRSRGGRGENRYCTGIKVVHCTGALSPKATAIQPVGAPSPNLSSLQSVERTGLTFSAQVELTKTPTPTGCCPLRPWFAAH